MQLYIPEEHILLVNRKLQKYGYKFVDDAEELHNVILPLVDPDDSPFKYYFLQKFKSGVGGHGLKLYIILNGMTSSYIDLRTEPEMLTFLEESAKIAELLKDIKSLTITFEEFKKNQQLE